jgi:glutamate/tyrosine decarboxylase-like PLP-dependent enzyme
MAFSVLTAYNKLQNIIDNTSEDVLPRPEVIAAVTKKIVLSLPQQGLGEAATEHHLLNDLTPGFQGQKTGSNYYGFVTGGLLPIAEVADNVVTAYDQNSGVHLPDQSINTTVEDAALNMLIELLDLGDGWHGRTLTTGATGSNVLGLACGREAVIKSRLEARGIVGGIGELGLLSACAEAGVRHIQILTTLGHSSLYKAASIVGIGRSSVVELPAGEQKPWSFDIQRLESELSSTTKGVVSIVSVSAGEINTGCFATYEEDMKKIRELCDKHGAWLHVDGGMLKPNFMQQDG